MTLNFLDREFGRIFKPTKPEWKKQQERLNNKYYQRLRRLCKKHNITYSRDLSYWDFSEPIRTVGGNEGVDCYQSAYEYIKEKLETQA